MDVGINVLKFLVGDVALKTLLDLYHGDIGHNILPFSFTVDKYLCRKMREFTSMRACVAMFGRRMLYSTMLVEHAAGGFSIMVSIPRQEKRAYIGFLMRFPWSIYDGYNSDGQFQLASDMRKDCERVDIASLYKFIGHYNP